MSVRVSSRNQKKPKVDYNFGDVDVAKKTRKRKSNIKANKTDTDVSSPAVKKGRGRSKKVIKDVEIDNDKEEASSKSNEEIKPDNEMDSSKADNVNETKDASDGVDDDKDNATESSPAKNKKAGKARGRPAKKTGRLQNLKKVTENVVEPDNTSKSVEGKESTVSDDEKAIDSAPVAVEA